MRNDFYNRKEFQLADCEFSKGTIPYTYVVLSKWKVEEGDYIVVPVSTFKTFSYPDAHQHMKLVKVVKVRKFESVEHTMKMAIQKIDSRLYIKVAQLRKAYIKKHLR